MNNILKKWRKKYSNNIGKYALFALGEIILIIIGILIAVNINERLTANKDNEFRCQYLEELSFAFDKDIEDVKVNLNALNNDNPLIKSFLTAVENKKLKDLDSVIQKIDVFNDYVTFLQQSKSKIEELKYSKVNLITSRDLKNKVLVYQESKITYLLDQQRRLNEWNEKIENYFLPINTFVLDEIQSDIYFYNLINRKYYHNDVMIYHYDGLLTDLHAMKELIKEEQKLICIK